MIKLSCQGKIFYCRKKCGRGEETVVEEIMKAIMEENDAYCL